MWAALRGKETTTHATKLPNTSGSVPEKVRGGRQRKCSYFVRNFYETFTKLLQNFLKLLQNFLKLLQNFLKLLAAFGSYKTFFH